jgi:hypothetical protein
VTLKQLLNRLNATTERAVNQREQLLQDIETALKIHTRLEEEIFYPAFKDAVKSADEHLYYEAVEEHHLVDFVLKEIKAADAESEEFSAKAKVLQDIVLHHAEEEEEPVMFLKARRAMSADELSELGRNMQTRKQELQSSTLTRLAKTTGRTVGKFVNGVRRRAA